MYTVGKMKIRKITLFDVITGFAILVGVAALIALVYFNAVPVKLADIKVPVATDKSSYYPSQQVGGIFFGETFYDGNVKILREVFCANYHGVIKPPAEAADGDFFDTIAKPRKLDGTTVPIGTLPADVPIGQNCVIRFRNVYNIQTPFGVRHEEYEYYTQNFSIITKERRQQLDCEAKGGSIEKCLDLQDNQAANTTTNPLLGSDNLVGGGRDDEKNTNNSETNNTSNTTTNNTTNNNTTTPPPVTVREECTIDTLFGLVKIGCRDVAE
jgi:hypothetical protein